MKRVLTALVLIPLVLALVFRGPLWAVALVVYFFVVVGVREYLDLLVHYGIRPVSKALWVIVSLAGALAIAASTKQLGGGGEMDAQFRALVQVALLALALGPYILIVAAFRRPIREAIPAAAMTFLAIPWIVIPMLLMVAYRGMPNGWFYVLYILVVVWSGDIFAYYVGRAIGKHRLAPGISPKKSWEGAIASVVGSATLAGVLACWRMPLTARLHDSGLLAGITDVHNFPLPGIVPAILGAAVINVAAQFGDLAESLLKRGASVKDSGNLLPGHGGVLDRIDALLFASPVAAVVFVMWML